MIATETGASRTSGRRQTMAKYTVDYACGHGGREMQMVGAHKDRERRIEWMQRNVKCPACNKAERVARDDAAPRRAEIRISFLPMTVVVELTGQIEANKAELQREGWGWAEGAVGALGFLSDRPEWHFTRTWDYSDPATLRAAIANAVAATKAIGWEVQPLTDTDLAFALDNLKRTAATREAEAMADKAEKAAKLAQAAAANPRPIRPAWYAGHVAAGDTIRCNRKIYGSREPSIYVNDKRIVMTAEQVAEIETYWRAFDAYKAVTY